MRRNGRNRKNKEDKLLGDKIIFYSGIGIAIMTLIAFALLMYSKILSEDMGESTIRFEEMTNISEDNENNEPKTVIFENTESASTEIGKSIEEAQKETNNNIEDKEKNSINTNKSNEIKITEKKLNSNSHQQQVNAQKNNTVNTNNTSENNTNISTAVKKELSFQKPVEGEIVREYAKDNLIYSETLQEWTTHLGIDIKADKTTVVKAAEAGVIKSIKNDPRYGLAIVIDHGDGMQTIYSNLLTSEFVVEGEQVEKGQSIGTVGNTAVFEIADEAHLHFEILKDNIQQDPNIYIK